jgi:putative membrane-bound dehydrogenase-like protein
MNRLATRVEFWCVILLSVTNPGARGQQAGRAGGFTPEESVQRMVVPEGFHVELFAAEPMVRQPVTASFDERGRLWVVEYLQYPNPAGLKPVTVDQYLRTEYDKMPEPPPRGVRGADRIKILEDTDGDGRADSVKVFAEGLNLASALAVGHGGVFVGQAPYLLFYPDRNHDDRPDGDPEVLLTGFGLQDAHAVVNSMTWGPDGWLYGAQGSTVTARIRGYGFQQGIWRYHPRTRQFELFAEGGGNTWGLDFDLAGNAFGSSNGAYITFHMVQGGYYLKGFAKHGPLHNPHAYGYFGPIVYQGTKHGGHVTPGGIIYKGDAFPPSFRGTFIGGNLLSNAVYWHVLKRTGSTFAGRHGGTLIDSRDRWFRPIDLLAGPDAAVYVVDWYDQRAAHLDPRDSWDRTNGRIYHVVYGTRRKLEPFDLSKRSSTELVALRTSTNDWFPAEARRILAERRDPSIVAMLRRMLTSDRDETVALRDLWALHVSGGLDDAIAIELLGHPLAGVRRWSIRLLGDDHRMNRDLRTKLMDLATVEPDAMVRSQLASSCQRWEAGDALPILGRLVRHDEDLRDPYIPNLVWWAFERQLRQDRDAVLDLLCAADVQHTPLLRDAVLERVARALASEGSDGDFGALARLLAAAHGPDWVARILTGMEKGLEGRKLARTPAPLAEPLAQIWAAAQPAPGVVLIRLAARLDNTAAIGAAVRQARDRRAAASDRIAMIELLGQLGRSDDHAALIEILNRDPSATIQLAAVAALGGYSQPAIAPPLIERYRSASANVRARILGLLCTRRPWAGALLDAIEHRQLAAKDLSAGDVQLVARLADPALLVRLEAAWGKIPRVGSPEKKQRIAEIRGLLPEGDKGNAARGKPIFKENCAVCHKLFNEGETIGPDLTGSERGDLDFLMTSLVDPSALVRKEYQSQTIALRDGRVLTGLVIDENDQSLTLVDSNRQKTVIPRDAVEAARLSDVSLMPEGMLDKLTEPQIRDLFRYVQSSGGR